MVDDEQFLWSSYIRWCDQGPWASFARTPASVDNRVRWAIAHGVVKTAAEVAALAERIALMLSLTGETGQ